MESKLVPAADKTIKIIEYLADNPSSPYGVSDIAHSLSYSKGTVYSILQTLMENQWVEKNPLTNKYTLSNRLLTLSGNLKKNNRIISDFMLVGNDMEHQCNELINLHFPHGTGSSVLAAHILPTSQLLRVDFPIDTTFSATFSSAAKCLICEYDDMMLKRVFEHNRFNYTPSTIQVCETFIEEIHTIRKRGYAFNYAEMEEGVCSVGAPVRNAQGNIIAAINIVVPQTRFTEDRKQFLINLVCNGADRLSRLRGWIP